jgi:hypothetical protein
MDYPREAASGHFTDRRNRTIGPLHILPQVRAPGCRDSPTSIWRLVGLPVNRPQFSKKSQRLKRLRSLKRSGRYTARLGGVLPADRFPAVDDVCYRPEADIERWD